MIVINVPNITGQLIVNVLNGSLNRDSFLLKMSSFCQVTLGKKYLKTQICKDGGKTPFWNENLIFNIEKEQYFTISVYDSPKIKILMGDTIIGTSRPIYLNQVFAQFQTQEYSEIFNKKEKVGTIILRLKWQPCFVHPPPMNYYNNPQNYQNNMNISNFPNNAPNYFSNPNFKYANGSQNQNNSPDIISYNPSNMNSDQKIVDNNDFIKIPQNSQNVYDEKKTQKNIDSEKMKNGLKSLFGEKFNNKLSLDERLQAENIELDDAELQRRRNEEEKN